MLHRVPSHRLSHPYACVHEHLYISDTLPVLICRSNTCGTHAHNSLSLSVIEFRCCYCCRVRCHARTSGSVGSASPMTCSPLGCSPTFLASTSRQSAASLSTRMHVMMLCDQNQIEHQLSSYVEDLLTLRKHASVPAACDTLRDFTSGTNL